MSTPDALALAMAVAAAAACTTSARAPGAASHSNRVTPAPAVPPDSEALAKAARSAQHDFESLRRSHLQRVLPWGSQQCDEIIGRFCLRHGEPDGAWEPPPEADEVRRGRADLVVQLDTLASVTRDPWVTGHHVRYLVEAKRTAEALAAARDCRAEPAWWCAALEGYVLHSAGRAPEADSVYATALAGMPHDERCRWNDVSLLVDLPSARRAYRRAPCAYRTAIDDRFWALADPLWLVPGNDRRTEHYSRLVLDRLQERAASGYGLRWGDDLAELLVRYGWPAGWERQWGRPGTIGLGSVVSHHHRGARTFAPPAHVLDAPLRTGADAWPLEPELPRSAHLTPYADDFTTLGYQLAVFPRRETAVVVAAYDLGDSIAPSSEVRAGIAVWPDASRHTALAPTAFRGRHGVLIDTIAGGPAVVSLEALARRERRAARSRFGITIPTHVPGSLTLSDVLLFRPGDSLPHTLEEAARRARESPDVRAGDRLGLYWEVTGAVPGEPLDVTVSLEREGKSWIRKAVEWIGLADDRSVHTRLRWDEEPQEDGIVARALVLELPNLDSGRYRLTITAGDAAHRSDTVSRMLFVP